MKTHLSLRTRDLDKSVEFYRTLLNATPAKRYGDYALFITSQPPLELALSPDAQTRPDSSVHFGLASERPEAVSEAIERLSDAGYRLDVETEQTCCYAKQNKVWAADPDGRRWEVYYVIEESESHSNGGAGCCATA